MRIKLDNPKKFIAELTNGMSLKQLALNLKINYSNLKQYCRGEKTFPKEVFDILLKLSPRKNFWKKNKKELPDNWGGVKGGLASAKSDPHNKKAAYARRFRKIKKVDISLNKFFCEFYGILLGDGCISNYIDFDGINRHVIYITCNKALDSEFLQDLKRKLNEEYGLYSYYYEYKNKNICNLIIKNKSFALNLNKTFGVPIGPKYDKLHISKKILKLDWSIKKYLLRGLFDTDGCIVANKRERYRYPWISISSKSQRFRKQLILMLREQGYPAYSTGDDVCVRGIENVKRWFQDIGSSNLRNLKKYEYFLKHKCLPARLFKGL